MNIYLELFLSVLSAVVEHIIFLSTYHGNNDYFCATGPLHLLILHFIVQRRNMVEFQYIYISLQYIMYFQ